MVFADSRLARFSLNFHRSVEILFTLAGALGALGLLNASYTRITRATVRLAKLPKAWRGRRAALVSDLHRGHVRNSGCLRRIVTSILSEEPDTVFIVGDLFDGTAIDALGQQNRWSNSSLLKASNSSLATTSSFAVMEGFLDAVAAAGVRVLSDEKVGVDGLQIIGVSYRNAVHRSRFGSLLKAVGIDQARASGLLTHAPDHPDVAEVAGVCMQVSGHTHRGQFVPWSWIARRAHRQFVYGLSRIGKMVVFTSSGAGPRGPPLRLGSNPEIVMLEFQ